MSVVCRFTDGSVVSGHLHIKSVEVPRFFLCHDSPIKDGAASPCKWGHRFSWTFKYLKELDRFTDDIVELSPGVDPRVPIKSDVDVSLGLLRFCQHVSTEIDLVTMFSVACKPFDALNKYELSEKAGFIKISGEVKTMNGTFPKSVEIKLARFVKGVANFLAQAGLDFVSDDAAVEKLHNSLVSFQTGSMFRLEILSGEDILIGYDSKNYSRSAIGTLHKSCMNDKADYLGLYTNNPCVSLAVLRSDAGIEARCLVWTAEDGTTMYDRVYYSHEWMQPIMVEKMVGLGHTCARARVDSGQVCSVKFTHHRFQEYPYLDTFRFLNMAEGRAYGAPDICVLPKAKYIVLATAHGVGVPAENR